MAKRLEEIEPYEKKIVISHYLKSNGVRDTEQLLDGSEGSLEEAIKSWDDKQKKKRSYERSSHGLGDEDFWWEDTELYD